MTNPDVAPPPEQPRTSVIDRTGAAIVREVRLLTRRLRALSTETWGAAAAIGALVVLLIVIAVARDDESTPAIPDNTPADLREPLAELHQAVNGDSG